jgi:hypothetical protein
MMKKILALLSIVTISLSCNEEFLEEFPTSYTTPEKLGEALEINPNVGSSGLLGIYESMFAVGTGYENDFPSGRNDYDFGHRGFDVFGDMLSGDLVLGGKNYGWLSDLSELTTTEDYTTNNNYTMWRYYYYIILLANSTIDAFGGSDANPESAEAQQGLGQALGARAYGYFYLLNYFANDFDSGDLVLPIYTNSTSENQPKSSVGEVIDLIISDLTRSKTLLTGFSRSAPNIIDEYVASTYLAYAYAMKGDNANASTAAKFVIDNSGKTIQSIDQIVSGMNDVNSLSNNVLWGTDLTVDNGLGLRSWWGQCDIYSYSYAWAGDPKVVDISLFDQIADDDIRKSWFLTADYPASYATWYPLAPHNKFYHEGRRLGGQRNVTADYIYNRIEEMYLLHAEAEAALGNDASARASLKAILDHRIPDSSYVDALSGAALQDEIYLQMRIELWGEGKSYLAMKRLRKTITRGANWLDFAGQSFDYNDERLTFEIPEIEIRNNPNISDQNP